MPTRNSLTLKQQNLSNSNNNQKNADCSIINKSQKSNVISHMRTESLGYVNPFKTDQKPEENKIIHESIFSKCE